MNDFSIPIRIEEASGLHRASEPIRIGVPFPEGLLRAASDFVVTNAAGAPIPCQGAPLAFWSDRSIKWLLVDALVDVAAGQRIAISVRPKSSVREPAHTTAPAMRLVIRPDAIEVETGAARFEILRSHPGPFASVRLGNISAVASPGSRIQLVGRDKHMYEPVIESLTVEEQGAIRATVVSEGHFGGSRGASSLRFKSRASFFAGSAAIALELQIRNTRAAVHPGGIWDLGDPGSFFFKDLTLSIHPRGPAQTLRWYAEIPSAEREQVAGRWSLYQDSSGGEQWNSPTHVDSRSTPTVTFRGYRVQVGNETGSDSITEGERAQPGVTVSSDDTWIAATLNDFWQNFPKALRWEDGVLSLGVFPKEARSDFELQGGEQKRHTIFLDFGATAESSSIAQLQHPLSVSVDPAWIETTEAIPWFTAGADGEDPRYSAYVHGIIEGPQSFVAKREIIDEYGWRNFGDLYADHEAVYHRGQRPFVSHYNNQYDFLYGAFVHFERSGDPRWRQLLEQAALHVIDIDIYHTRGDRAAFNGGLFWHTDHHLPAATCSHRAYSRSNGGRGYGGGPSNEHNYTSGLLHYYYLTGDRDAAAAVGELAEWVMGMDDGARTLFGLIDAGATGGASQTRDVSYHHPGRGAGNSVNALLDAYALSGERRYMAKAEELIERCIHPSDDIAAQHLDEPERRWSYLVFLQILGKYISTKVELRETDYHFHYARESLLHYAEWMTENEVPYKDLLHKVELPTETWPAHDVRKCHVLHVAAWYCTGPQRNRFRERAHFFFERCLTDLLEFSTAYLTRPLVILCVYGWIHNYFRHHETPLGPDLSTHNYRFGSPATFTPQRSRLRATLVFKLRVLATEVTRMLGNIAHGVVARLRRSG